ncbi:MAG: FecR domain-containing protein [Pseudomonadota bacterium]
MSEPSSDQIQQALTWCTILSDEPSELQRSAFDQWLQREPEHQTAFVRAEKLWLGLDTLKEHALKPSLTKPLLSERLDQARRSLHAALQPSTWTLVTRVAVVLPLLAFAVTLLLTRETPIDHTSEWAKASTLFSSGVGETRPIQLADGSTITLGASSAAEVSIGAGQRQVHLLHGDLLLDVFSDPKRPFSVISNHTKALVLGTEFEVRNRGQKTVIAVKEGIVDVRIVDQRPDSPGSTIATEQRSTDQQVLLRAGSRAKIDGRTGKIQSESYPVSAIGAWKNDRLVYYGAPLSDVVADARRYTKRAILFEDKQLAALRINATFNGKDIEGMLMTLPAMYPITIDVSHASTIMLRAKP